MLQYNLFLTGDVGLGRVVEEIAENTSKGGGVGDLLGYIFTLLPFGLIDAARNTSRIGRWVLWTVAILLLFYDTSSGRGPVMLAVLAIIAGRTSNWRRIVVALALAFAVFSVASVLRGDTTRAQVPFLDGIIAPFFNLALLVNAGCGSAPWYDFIAEFLKKFLPAFLINKTVFAFNVNMTVCINPANPDLTNGVSVFTWLGEIFYYRPSLLTALLAGLILSILARAVDRRLVKYQLSSARLYAGLFFLDLPRSRTQDAITYLIAQLVFLVLFWPYICNLTRILRRLLMPSKSAMIPSEAQGEPL